MVASVIITNKKQIHQYKLHDLLIGAAAWQQEAKQLKVPMVRSKKKKAASKKKRL
jgi:hypothetical protein